MTRLFSALALCLALLPGVVWAGGEEVQTSSARLELLETVPYLDAGELVHKRVWQETICRGDAPCTSRVYETFACPERPGSACPAPAPEPATYTVPMMIIIQQAARRYGVSASWMISIAACESRFNPAAVNWQDGSSGLFQFQPRTWAWASVQAGYGSASVFDAEANANTAAWLLASEGPRHWTCARWL